MTDFIRFNRSIAKRLLVWSALSVVCGAVAMLVDAGSGVARGVGIQFVAWGVIDAVIARAGLAAQRRYLRRYPDQAEEARRARRTLRILKLNAGLDVLYVAIGAGGVALGSVGDVWGAPGALVLGHAVGIIVQGVFLLVFDLVHVRILRSTVPAWYIHSP